MPKITPLTKNHAVIHTATIDVKVIRIDKRQMTLSVFRQLEEKSIVMPNGELQGIPWGKVNYSWENKSVIGSSRLSTDFHIIWQCNSGKLYRGKVPNLNVDDYKMVMLSASSIPYDINRYKIDYYLEKLIHENRIIVELTDEERNNLKNRYGEYSGVAPDPDDDCFNIKDLTEICYKRVFRRFRELYFLDQLFIAV